MDINIPEMDGIESTQHILKYEKENTMRYTPIVD